MSVLVTVGALALIALWAMSAYGRLVGLRNQVTKGWRQIAVQLKRRHDLIVDLVNTVKGAAEFERDTLEAVIAARNRAATASGPADAGRKESELSAALGRSSRSPKRILSSPPTRTCGRCATSSPAPRPGRRRASVLQQRRHEVQHRHRGDSRQHHRRVRRLQAAELFETAAPDVETGLQARVLG